MEEVYPNNDHAEIPEVVFVGSCTTNRKFIFLFRAGSSPNLALKVHSNRTKREVERTPILQNVNLNAWHKVGRFCLGAEEMPGIPK